MGLRAADAVYKHAILSASISKSYTIMKAYSTSIKFAAALIGLFLAGTSTGYSQLDVVAGAGGPIPDDGYDGTLGSMACATLDNSSGTVVFVNEVSLNLSIVHTFVGDLTAKIMSPEGTILTVFSRPGLPASPDDGTGCCGDSSNLDNTALLWVNGGSVDSELMGGTIDTDMSVCTDDGECDFFPNPDGGPGTNLDDFEGESAIGIWLVCVGDGAGADTGDFNNAALTIQGNIPVELVSFDAEIHGLDVFLNWKTSSETNNAGFEIQMQNGESWHVLGWVEGNGTTTIEQSYAFTATNSGVGTHLFRLKQIDFDGTFEYSPEIEATIETPGTHLISAAYPNPFNPQSRFSLAVATDQRVTAALFNTLGQRVATLFEGLFQANRVHEVTIDGAGLPSGLYVIRVQGERFLDALNVTLIK